MRSNSARSRLVFLALLAISFLGIHIPAQAVEMQNLYQAEVAVADQSSGSRNDAFKTALAQVLVKVSGALDIVEAPAAEPILQKAARYVRQYRYIEKELDRESASESTDPTHLQQQLFLSVEFTGDAIQKALRAASLPVWSGNRPSTLIWLAVKEPRNRFIVGDDTEASVKQAVLDAAGLRGVPLIFPIMDLEDSRRVAFADISGGFTDTLLSASERYNAQIVVAGYMEINRQGLWTAKWTVLRDNVSSSWMDIDVALQQASVSGMNGVADILAARYAFSADAGGQLVEYVVAVGQVLSIDDYATILNHLSGLVLTEDVTPVRVESSYVYFRVLMRGSLQELERALALMPELKRVESGSAPLPVIASQKQVQVVPEGESPAVQILSVRDRADLNFSFLSR